MEQIRSRQVSLRAATVANGMAGNSSPSLATAPRVIAACLPVGPLMTGRYLTGLSGITIRRSDGGIRCMRIATAIAVCHK